MTTYVYAGRLSKIERATQNLAIKTCQSVAVDLLTRNARLVAPHVIGANDLLTGLDTNGQTIYTAYHNKAADEASAHVGKLVTMQHRNLIVRSLHVPFAYAHGPDTVRRPGPPPALLFVTDLAQDTANKTSRILEFEKSGISGGFLSSIDAGSLSLITLLQNNAANITMSSHVKKGRFARLCDFFEFK